MPKGSYQLLAYQLLIIELSTSRLSSALLLCLLVRLFMSGGGKVSLRPETLHPGTPVPGTATSKSRDTDIMYPDPMQSARGIPASEISYEDNIHEQDSGLIASSGVNHWQPAQVHMKVEDLVWEQADFSKCENPDEIKFYLGEISTLLQAHSVKRTHFGHTSQ